MSKLRIVSLLPSATEMLCALDLADNIVGITHECDYPPFIRSRPSLVQPVLSLENLTQAEIDQAVSQQIEGGESLYRIDQNLLQELAPDLIVTQDLCQVCAPSDNELSRALEGLSKKPKVISLSPKSLGDVLENLLELGTATGRHKLAQQVVNGLKKRLDDVTSRAKSMPSRPRVFCMEWIDPLYCGGHWVPEMVEHAGGIDALASKNHSLRISWAQLQQWDPQILVIMPCGFALDRVLQLVPQLQKLSGWPELSAVRSGRLYAVDANSYFARPGPRLIDGTELLAHLIHPEIFGWNGPTDAFAQIAG